MFGLPAFQESICADTATLVNVNFHLIKNYLPHLAPLIPKRFTEFAEAASGGEDMDDGDVEAPLLASPTSPNIDNIQFWL